MVIGGQWNAYQGQWPCGIGDFTDGHIMGGGHKTRYSKRYLRALATRYWLGINTIQS